MKLLRQLLARIRCELTDHDHETVTIDGVELNRCRRECGWSHPELP